MSQIKKSIIRLSIGFSALAALFLAWLLFSGLKPIELDDAVLVTIERGATLRCATETLEQSSVIHDSWSFKLLARVFGLSSEIKAGGINLKTGPLGFRCYKKFIADTLLKIV